MSDTAIALFCENMITLETLGQRICIIGPSNSGKSTLAQKLAAKMQVDVCHLDQLAHLPGTNWQPRANEDWQAEHDLFIEKNAWVIEGNYTFCIPQRLARATYLIWLDFSSWSCVKRYLLRTLKNDVNRPGRLANATREFSLDLISYMLFTYPRKRQKTMPIIDQSGVTILHLYSIKELNRYYRHWGLE